MVWVALLALIMLTGALLVSYRSVSKNNPNSNNHASVPDHVWEELQAAIPKADYNYLRATSDYMGSSPNDLVARLNHVGAVHDPADPKQVRLSILELRLAEVEKIALQARSDMPNDLRIIWISVSSVATVSSLVALVFYILQAGFLD